jgi:hypothetical protein
VARFRIVKAWEYFCLVRLGQRSTCGLPHDFEALPLQISEHNLHFGVIRGGMLLIPRWRKAGFAHAAACLQARVATGTLGRNGAGKRKSPTSASTVFFGHPSATRATLLATPFFDSASLARVIIVAAEVSPRRIETPMPHFVALLPFKPSSEASPREPTKPNLLADASARQKCAVRPQKTRIRSSSGMGPLYENLPGRKNQNFFHCHVRKRGEGREIQETTQLPQPARKKLLKPIAAWYPRAEIWVEGKREEGERGRIHIPTYQASVRGAALISRVRDSDKASSKS